MNTTTQEKPHQLIPATQPQHLKSHIAHHINMADVHRILALEVKENMAESLDRFCQLSILKFIVGQLEHGGDIRDKDLRKEQEMEDIDSFWYREAETQWPKKKS